MATRSTPKLDAFRAWVEGLGRSYKLDIEPESQDTKEKLKWLAAKERDFLKVTPQLQQHLVRVMKEDVERLVTGAGNIRAEETLERMGAATKRFIELRFDYNGNDVPMRELSKVYLAWKFARGYPANIGVAREDLRKAISKARFVWRKAG